MPTNLQNDGAITNQLGHYQLTIWKSLPKMQGVWHETQGYFHNASEFQNGKWLRHLKLNYFTTVVKRIRNHLGQLKATGKPTRCFKLCYKDNRLVVEVWVGSIHSGWRYLQDIVREENGLL